MFEGVFRRLWRRPGRRKKHAAAPSNSLREEIARIQGELGRLPLEPNLHRRLAAAFAELAQDLGVALRAYACLRTAEALGGQLVIEEGLRKSVGALEERLGGIEALDHNRSYRYRTLAAAIRSLAADGRCRVLDVGGGDGGLSWFVPEAEYVLAEPTVNGIDGTCLPFADRAFDVVCACHVLEHIRPESRPAFIDELARVSNEHVLLLNPFEVSGSQYPRRLEIVLELTGSEWAAEHLKCGLPDLAEVEEYASSRGFDVEVEPTGDLALALALVFVNHFARAAGRRDELPLINALFNGFSLDRISSPLLPVAFLVHLRIGERRRDVRDGGSG